VAVIAVAMLVAVVVRVVVAGSVRMLVIGAWLGLERSLFPGHLEAECAHHVIEHVVCLVGDEIRSNLQAHVAIAEVIGGARELPAVRAANDGQLLGLGVDPQDLPVARAQMVTVLEARATLDEDTHVVSDRSSYATLRPLALVEIELGDQIRLGRKYTYCEVRDRHGFVR